MEKFIYEARPYFYFAVALFAMIASKGSLLMTSSGVLIGLCGISVGLLRYDQRQQVAPSRKSKPVQTKEDHYGQKPYLM